MHVSKQHKISQLDGENDFLENGCCDKPDTYKDAFFLGMQVDGFSKLEIRV